MNSLTVFKNRLVNIAGSENGNKGCPLLSMPCL